MRRACFQRLPANSIGLLAQWHEMAGPASWGTRFGEKNRVTSSSMSRRAARPRANSRLLDVFVHQLLQVIDGKKIHIFQHQRRSGSIIARLPP